MIVLGLMSGTSVDGIDAALIDILEEGDGLKVKLIGYQETPHDPALRARVLAQLKPDTSRVDEIALLNAELGEAFAVAAKRSIDASGREPDLIASHGQTIWHHVREDGSVAATLQIGEPSVIAERLGVTVVADFRPRDVAAGGQGAPLASYPDSLLFAHPTRARAIQNIGGIGNVTWVAPDSPPLAFDTGPGNVLIDLAVAQLTGGTFDEGGALAATGRPDEAVVARLLAHTYFAQRPPKSTGRELYTEAYAREIVAQVDGRPQDTVATLTLLTARSIADQYRRWLPRLPDDVVLGGGGARNPTLRAWLSRELDGVEIKDHDDFGLPSAGREAIYFAVMGYQALHGRANTVASATGARHPVVMGKIVPGANYATLARKVRPDVAIRRMTVTPL